MPRGGSIQLLSRTNLVPTDYGVECDLWPPRATLSTSLFPSLPSTENSLEVIIHTQHHHPDSVNTKPSLLFMCTSSATIVATFYVTSLFTFFVCQDGRLLLEGSFHVER